MKTRTFLRHSTIFATIALFTIVACEKEPLNPPVEDLPGSPFDVTLDEIRDQMPITWTLQGTNTFENSLNESIKTPVVTDVEGNSFILKATAKVNVESSATNCVAIQAVGTSGKEFRLTYKGEGATTIKVWNGSGTSAVTKSFHVESRDKIEVEGLWFRYGYNHRVSENPNLTEPYPFTEAEDLIVKHPLTSRPNNIIACEEDIRNGNEDRGRPTYCDFSTLPYQRPWWYVWVDENDHSKGDMLIDDITSGCELEFVGLYPENCSYRRILAFESEWEFKERRIQTAIRVGYIKEDDEYTHWPNVRDCNVDVSEFSGRKLWVPSAGNEYVALVKVATPNPKYFFMSHTFED